MLYLEEWKPLLEDLEDAELGVMLRAMITYLETDEPPVFSDRILRVAWTKIKKAIDLDAERYEQRCKNNKRAANIRWGKDDQSEEAERQKEEQGSRFRPAPAPVADSVPADEADESTSVVEVARPTGSTPLPAPSDEPRPLTHQDVMDGNLEALKKKLTAAGVRMAFADYAIMVEWINAVGFNAVSDAADTAIRQAAGSVHYVFTILQKRQQKSRRSFSPSPAPQKKKLTEEEEKALAAKMEREMEQQMERMMRRMERMAGAH